MNIEMLRNLCSDDTIKITQHVAYRMQERNILYSDVKLAILNGEIIEEYPQDSPFESSLVLGTQFDGMQLHVVCAIGNNSLWVITAYKPTLDKWNDDYKTRKAGK